MASKFIGEVFPWAFSAGFTAWNCKSYYEKHVKKGPLNNEEMVYFFARFLIIGGAGYAGARGAPFFWKKGMLPFSGKPDSVANQSYLSLSMAISGTILFLIPYCATTGHLHPCESRSK